MSKAARLRAMKQEKDKIELAGDPIVDRFEVFLRVFQKRNACIIPHIRKLAISLATAYMALLKAEKEKLKPHDGNDSHS